MQKKGYLLEAAEVQPSLKIKAHSNSIETVASHPSSPVLATGSHDKTIKIWDAEKGQCQQTLKGHGAGVWSV
jgi:WD40 repeat protein